MRNKKKLNPGIAENCELEEGDAMNYSSVKNAIAGHDVVYVNLAGNLEEMAKNKQYQKSRLPESVIQHPKADK